MPKTVIHVNQHRIRANRKRRAAEREPVITCKGGGANRYAVGVLVMGPCRVVYSPDRPLPCGATVWIETYSPVILEGEASYKPCKKGVDEQ